jgi:hypothetical protein
MKFIINARNCKICVNWLILHTKLRNFDPTNMGPISHHFRDKAQITLGVWSQLPWKAKNQFWNFNMEPTPFESS